MAYLRHMARHLQRTVELHLGAALDQLGWTTETPPFGTQTARYVVTRLDESDLKSVEGNLFALSFESSGELVPQELGGGNVGYEQVFFVDCLGVSDTIALAMGEDVKDVFSGLAPGYSEHIPLLDFTNDEEGQVAVGYKMEFTEVARYRPPDVSYKPHWQIVSGTIEVILPGSE